MTTFADSTLPPVSKAPAEVQTAFVDMLARLTALCAAESDVADLGQGDPAFDAWFRDAEVARASVVAAAQTVILAAPRTSNDQQFRSACFALKIMLTTSDAEQFANASAFLRRKAEAYCHRSAGAPEAAVQFRSFYKAFDFLMALPDYAAEPLPCDMTMAMAA